MKKLLLLLSLAIALPYISNSQDLLVSSVGGTKSFKRYGNLPITVTFQNAGAVNITKSTATYVYLSTDNKYSANDLCIGSFGFGAINAGESKAVPYTNTNINLAPGSYYLIVIVDKTNIVAETNETNNTFVAGGYIVEMPDVDVYFTSFRLDKQYTTKNDVVYPIYTTGNKGATRVPAEIEIKFYLSGDPYLDANDPLVGSHYQVLGASNAAASTAGDKVTIPDNITIGTYYLIGQINGRPYFQEADMSNNNVVSEPITVGESYIDLDFTGQSWNASATETNGTKKLFLVFSIRNSGTTPVSGQDYTVYTGSNYNISANAYQTFLPQVILPGQTVQQSIELELYPSAQLPETFGLILKVNENGAIRETNYSNNTQRFTMGLGFSPHHTEPIVSYSIGSPYSSYNIITDTDKSLPIQIEFRNNGTEQQIVESYGFDFIARDAYGNYGGGGVLSTFFIVLQPGQTQIVNTALEFYSPLPPGSYAFDLHRYDSFVWLNGTFDVVSPKYSLSGRIQGEDGVPITKGNLLLYKKDATGIIQLQQQLTNTATNNFNFTVAKSDYALCFIPDATAFSAYVPTALTKSLTLTASSFQPISADKDITFQILKDQPFTPGAMFINGNVTIESLPAGRVAAPSAMALAVQQPVMVVLFSESGQIIAHTKTDASGNYSFKNLPAGNYQVLPVLSFDQTLPPTSVSVDLSRVNAQVDFVIQPNGVISNVKEILLTQSVSFTLPVKKYTDEPFSLPSASSAGLPITYTSSDPSVAEVVDGLVIINDTGEVTITGTQPGNETYQPSFMQQVLVIDKADQTLTFDALSSKTYGDEPFALSASVNSNLPVTYTSSNDAIAEILNGTLTIKSAGDVTITANQVGDNHYHHVSTGQVLHIGKATQTLSFEVLPDKTFGDEPFTLNGVVDSDLTVTYSSSDEAIAQIVDGILTIKSGGDVTITAIQGGDDRYHPVSTAQSLHIDRATQAMSFDAPPTKTYGDEPFALNAFTDSGHLVTYTSSNEEIVEIVNGMLLIKSAGEVTITATQAGDNRYLPVTKQQVLWIDKAIQVLSFDLLPVKTYGDEPFVLNAMVNSNLSVTFTSSDETVAEIVNGKLVIKSAGNAIITAEQRGNHQYSAAVDQQQILTVSKATQTITLDEFQVQHTGGEILLPSTSSAGLPILYVSGNQTVARIDGNVITILESGEATITATQEGNKNYEAAAAVARTLRVAIVLGTEKETTMLTVGPNPTTGKLKIFSASPVQRVSLSDMTGKTNQATLSIDELDIRDYAPGVYLLTIHTAENSKTFKIVKE